MNKRIAIVLALLPCATQADEAQPACPPDQDSCIFNWVENNTLRSLTWQRTTEDFEAPTLSFSPPTGYSLRSQQAPEFFDVDLDGWRDIVTFNPIGMVNGDFDVFATIPETRSFAHIATLHGHSLLRDSSGLLVAAGRSGAGQNFEFFEVGASTLNPIFNIDVPSECTVTMGNVSTPWRDNPNDLPTFLRDQGDLVKNYCTIFEQSDAPPFFATLRGDTDITFIPTNSVFYCEIETNKGLYAVNATLDLDGYRYTYGPLGGAPDLALARTRNDVGAEPDALYFNNGAYTYILHNAPWGLTVMQAGSQTPIFDKTCDQASAFDNLADIEPF